MTPSAAASLPIGTGTYPTEQWSALGAVVVLIGVVVALRRWHSRHNPTYRRLTEHRDNPPAGTTRDHWEGAVDRYLRTHGTNVIMGADGRLSTSKTIAALWTVTLAYLLTVMGLIGASASKPGRTLDALMSPTSDLYLVLIGGPFAAAVIAKVTVGNGVAAGSIQKTYAAKTGPQDITSNDQGSGDLVDSQYLLFNLIAILIVVVVFVRNPGFGAPPIPGFLAALTGGSAATYVANKSAVTNAPVITRVLPEVVRIGQTATAYGANLYAQTTTDTTVITVGGFAAQPVAGRELPASITFTIPPPTGPRYPTDQVDVVIKTVAGATAVRPGAVRIVPDAITVTGVKPQTVRAGAELVVHGSGFLNAKDVTVDSGPGANAAWPVVQLLPAPLDGPARTVSWPGPPAVHGSDVSLTVPIAPDTPDGEYELVVRRDGLSSTDTAAAPIVHVVGARTAAQPASAPPRTGSADNVGDMPTQRDHRNRAHRDPAVRDPLPDPAESIDAEKT